MNWLFRAGLVAMTADALTGRKGVEFLMYCLLVRHVWNYNEDTLR